MKKLTASQQKVLDYLHEATDDGISPTVRDICAATGLKSTSTVHAHLKTLEEQGYIIKEHGHRSLRLARSEPMLSVPVLGKVTAGLPIYAFEDVEGYVPFPKKKAVGSELFALRVMGESMRDIGILDNDIVVCVKTSAVQNGDIVVALMDEEATVKSFYKENGHYRLQPHNPDFEPIITNELTILGKVVSLYREF